MSHGEIDNLYNFCYYLIHFSPDSKYKHRDRICETVKRLGKKAVLDELMRQGKDTLNLNEAVVMARTIRDMD